MLRKKLGKQGPKPEGSQASKPIVPPKPSFGQTSVKSSSDPKDKLNKDRIAQLVANKIRQNKKENEIIQKIQSQVGSGERKRFKEYESRFSGTLKLTHNTLAPIDAKIPLKKTLAEYLSSNFKQGGYV